MFSFSFKVVFICAIFLSVEKITCLGTSVEHDQASDTKWSLSSLNPLSWLFPSKPNDSNHEVKGPPEIAHLPISRRAGLSDTKSKKTYNDLRYNRDVKERRKRRRKQPGASLKSTWNRNKSSHKLRERRRRRRRKQQANRRFKEDIIPQYREADRFSNHDDLEEYYNDDEFILPEARDANHQDAPHDLVMSDYDLRWPSTK